MKLLSRRHFLKNTAAALALLAGGTCLANPLRQAFAAGAPAGKEIWFICDTPKMIKNQPRGINVTNPGSVNVLEPATGEIYKIPLSFYGHTVDQNPARPHEAVTFEKWGRRGALVDLKEKTVLATVESEEGRLFFGHAGFIHGGKALVTSDDSYKRDEGKLIVRDASTLKQIGQIRSHGIKPHECVIIDNGRTILVANEGLNNVFSNVSWIDVASGKLLHQIVPDHHPNAIYSHVALSSDGWVSVVGEQAQPKPIGNGLIRLISPEGRVFVPKIPSDVLARTNGQVLTTIMVENSDMSVSTVPDANMVIVLNYKTQEFVGAIGIHEPKGLISDLSALAPSFGVTVSNARKKDVIKIAYPSPKDAPAVNTENVNFGGNGSHMARGYI